MWSWPICLTEVVQESIGCHTASVFISCKLLRPQSLQLCPVFLFLGSLGPPQKGVVILPAHIASLISTCKALGQFSNKHCRNQSVRSWAQAVRAAAWWAVVVQQTDHTASRGLANVATALVGKRSSCSWHKQPWGAALRWHFNLTMISFATSVPFFWQILFSMC